MNWKNKKQLFFILILVLGLVVPLFQALAQWEWLAVSIAEAIFFLFLLKFILVSTAFVEFSLVILGWVVGPNFIPLSGGITQNQFVLTGWEIVRDLTNVIFILVLVIIGLATALRIQEYKAKKLIPTLIMIALLINFTPIIMGFIIDASNITMNFFLSEFVGFENMLQRVLSTGSSFGEMVAGKTGLTAFIFQTVAMIGFNVVAGFIFLLFALLFLFRYIALWTLVILSPIAFLCYILPSTKKIWSNWWNQFIQWSIIGIIAAFFIYLSELMMVEFRGMTAPSVGITSFMTHILPYMLPLGLLILGFFVAITTSATGSGFIISGAKKAGGWAGREGFKKLGRSTIESTEKIGGWIGRRKPVRKALETGTAKWAKGKISRMPRPQIKIPGIPTRLEEKMEFEKLKGKYRKEAKLAISDPEMKKEVIGTLKSKPIGEKQKARYEALKEGVLKTEPSWVNIIGKDIMGQSTKDAIRSMSPKEFTDNISLESLRNKDVRDAMSEQQKIYFEKKASFKKQKAYKSPLERKKSDFTPLFPEGKVESILNQMEKDKQEVKKDTERKVEELRKIKEEVKKGTEKKKND